MGASGFLSCLDAVTGSVVWQVDITKDSKAPIPQWGFSSSPYVNQEIASVFAGGPESRCVVAYHTDSGELAWTSGEGTKSYCSVQAATIDNVEQLLICTDAGMSSFEPLTGKVFWEHRWPVEQARVVQPTTIDSTDVLLGTGMSGGTRRLSVRFQSGQWTINEAWTTKAFKPYFNDLVVHGDFAFGFDGNIFMCISLEDGKMRWRFRGYGNGQVLRLADNNLLLILSETGEVALVEANPQEHKEVAKMKAIEGKTWNHPVIAHGRLFVRNAEEIACFQLSEVN